MELFYMEFETVFEERYQDKGGRASVTSQLKFGEFRDLLGCQVPRVCHPKFLSLTVLKPDLVIPVLAQVDQQLAAGWFETQTVGHSPGNQQNLRLGNLDWSSLRIPAMQLERSLGNTPRGR